MPFLLSLSFFYAPSCPASIFPTVTDYCINSNYHVLHSSSPVSIHAVLTSASVLYCISLVLHLSYVASALSCICPMLHLPCPASVLRCTKIAHASCTALNLHCIHRALSVAASDILLIRVHHIRGFLNKKNQQSSYGSPEQNMDPKICAGGQKVHIYAKFEKFHRA